ncbi:Ypt/Rab-GAP domain of gyp1p superfamily protein [Forsythia ovata]|uniref:Ypt/Rab-GAP domain of gyp1p superfamily protein n=1 Tax=Forsythia ovata TaxID=205694 RepID=A0ABD1UCJ2_9LAMI
MHSFQIDSNAHLVVESNGTPSNDDSRPPNSESEIIYPDVQESHSPSNNVEYESEMLKRLRISDAPEITSRGGATSGDTESEWLWTLHQIVVDIVRTDNHLEFYENCTVENNYNRDNNLQESHSNNGFHDQIVDFQIGVHG